MYFESKGFYHVFNQGNNRQPIFFQTRNYAYFQQKMAIHLLPHAHLLAYCLMPNHFHFLIQVHTCNIPTLRGKPRSLNDSIAIMLRSYTLAINNQEGRSGSLFRQGTKAKSGTAPQCRKLHPGVPVGHMAADLAYVRTCFYYIHRNPVKARLTAEPEEWPYSSAAAYAGRTKDLLVNIELGHHWGFSPNR